MTGRIDSVVRVLLGLRSSCNMILHPAFKDFLSVSFGNNSQFPERIQQSQLILCSLVLSHIPVSWAHVKQKEKTFLRSVCWIRLEQSQNAWQVRNQKSCIQVTTPKYGNQNTRQWIQAQLSRDSTMLTSINWVVSSETTSSKLETAQSYKMLTSNQQTNMGDITAKLQESHFFGMKSVFC